ncbi:hypothetical protein [Lutibaculum baratangense]|uniref:Uncharacterized protein n=1 Tax=Lutibaculum baratangense AMV1 TaxID=631454 RepID=V4RJ12_9HYPH|nr:hypothetical protein [Lutibaculum baratangense]ESR25309.1 hypothetical protein N177_1826 [Lutibaculum baratangense AMV1]
MLFFVTGSPSGPANFGLAATRAIAESRFGEADFAKVTTFEQFEKAYKARKAEAFVVSLEAPDLRIAQVLQRAGAKPAFFEESFETTVGFLLAGAKPLDFRNAVRRTSRWVASSAMLLAMECAFRFPQPEHDTRLLSFLQNLSLFYGIDPETELIEQAAARLGVRELTPRTLLHTEMCAKFPRAAHGQAALEALPSYERSLLLKLAEGYDNLLGGDPVATCSWPPGFLVDAVTKEDYFRSPIEMLGPARRLTFGPYLHLPPGQWLFTAIIEVWDNASGNLVNVRARVGKQVNAAIAVQLPARAKQAVALPVTVEDPHHAIEVYFDMKEGAIEGRFAVHSLQIIRQDRSESPV